MTIDNKNGSLLFLGGDDQAHSEVELHQEVISIGRAPGNHLCLSDPQVSWRHALVQCGEGRCRIEDLNSTNGTFVGGSRVSGCDLKDDDIISIGPYVLQYRAALGGVSPASASEATLFSKVSDAARSVRGDGAEGQVIRLFGTAKSRLRKPGDESTQWANVLRQRLPFLTWVASYRAEHIKGDVVAALTVAVLLVPQGMAYAMLAGLPPIVGLYASILPMLVYALMGSARQVSVGPVALDSILVAVGIGAFAEAGSEAFVALALLLAGMVGTIQLVMGMLRMGFFVNFLSHPVLTGFTAAAVAIVATSQLKHFLGISMPTTHSLAVMFSAAAEQWRTISLPTLALAITSVSLLLALKRWMPRSPAPILTVLMAVLAVWLLRLDTFGVKIVGVVPSGLPAPSLPAIDADAMRSMLPLALTLAFVGFAETISIAKTLGHKYKYPIDANQELVAIGLANLGASVSQGYPVTGGLSRSAVNARAGARTPLAAVMAAVLVAASLSLLTPYLHYLPNAVLAAIILVSAVGLIDLKEIRYLFRVKRSEGGLAAFTFLMTLILGITQGLLAGIVASILLFIVLNTRPNAAVLGRLPATNIYRNVTSFPEAETLDGLAILRIDASFYFANTEFLKARITELLAEQGKSLKAIILDASAINDLDSSADTALHQIAHDFKSRNIEFYIAGVKGPVRDVMRRSGLYDVLGGDHFFFTIDAAVHRYQKQNAPGDSVGLGMTAGG